MAEVIIGHRECDVNLKPRVEEFGDEMLVAEQLFPAKSDPIFPNVSHDGKEIHPAREYLEGAGANPEELDELFGENGEWIFPQFPYDPLTTNPNIFNRTLKEHLLQLNRIIDRSLDVPFPDGYNRHGDGHSSRVTKEAQGLVQASLAMRGTTDQRVINTTLNQTTLIGRVHDVGNLFSRLHHGTVAAYMLQTIIPDIKGEQYKEFYDQACSSIMFHSSGKLREFTHEVWGEMPSEERWTKMVADFGLAGLAVIASDKIDVGRQRISDRADSESIFLDPHAEVNYWGKNAGWSLDVQIRELNWFLQYDPQINGSDIRKYPHFAAELRRKQEDQEYTPRYFEQWRDLFLKLYGERMVTFADCGFALFPEIDHVDVVFKGEEGMGNYYFRFEKENFDARSKEFLARYKSDLNE